MAPTPSRIRTAFLGTLAALLCAAGLTTVTAPAARADVLTDVITDIEVSPLDPSPFEIIISTVQFCLPTGTSAGDTFRLTVSEELLLLPVDFEITSLPDGDGELVGSGDVVPVAGGGGTVTVTLTDYASTRRDVCGSFFFGARLADTSYANTNEVTYTYDDGVFVETVTTREGSVRTRRSPDKFSFFTRDDQGTDDVDGAIRFGIQTPLGPFDTATITDIPDAGDGFTFDCDSITVRVFRLQDDGSLLRHRTIDPLSLDCTPGALILEVGPLNRDDELIRVNVDASITAQLGVYMNTVTVQIDDLAERADSATLERVMAGGVAEGTNTPDITIVKLDEDGNDADTADDAADLGLAPGDTGLVFTITNSGDEPLVNVEVTDEVIANGTITGLDCTFPDDSTGTTWDGPFAVDDTFDCTADLADVSADEVHHDVATVVGIGINTQEEVTDDNPYHAIVEEPVPDVSIVKLDQDGNDADTADDAADLGAEPGATGLVFTITNTGEEPLVDVEVTDEVIANGTITGLDCTFPDDSTGTTWDGPFAVDDTFDCTADLTDVSADEVHHDIATVTGVGEVSGLPVDDDNPYHAVVDLPPTPEIELVKGDENGNEADTADDAADLGAAPGATGLVLTITNTGDEPLLDVAITDVVLANGTITGLDCTFPDDTTGTTWAGPLAVGASFDCTADLTDVSPDEVHHDVGTVTAIGEVSGLPVEDDNPYHAVADVPPTPPTPAPPITPRIETGTPVTGGGMRSPLLSLLGFVLLAGATMALPQLGRRPRRGGPLA